MSVAFIHDLLIVFSKKLVILLANPTQATTL
jgi:hypothetical protein